MNHAIKIFIIVIGSVGFFTGVLVVGSIVVLYFTDTQLEQIVATNLNVSNEWTEIRPYPALQTRRMVTELAMTIPTDRRTVKPQIQVIDMNGNIFEMGPSGLTYRHSGDLIIFTPNGGFPETKYKEVRIRSDEPFTCEGLFWIERNPK